MSHTIRLSCSTCGEVLTKYVSLVPSDSVELRDNDGEPRLAAGGYYIAKDDDFAADGNYILNLDDLVNVKNHADPERLNGCCGFDGCDGINAVCENGHDVGIRRSDCWVPHYAAFSPTLVVALEH